MNENIFHSSAVIIFMVAMGISIYHRLKADRDSGEKVSSKDEAAVPFFALRIGALISFLSIVGYLIYPPWLAWSKVGLPESIRWLGIGIGIVGVSFFYWIFSSLGQGISPTVATRKQHKLVTSGPYHWVRHPLYTVATTNFLAIGIMADSWFIAIMAVILFILLALRTPNEEAHLIEKFGDEYREYIKRTGRFLPKIV
jgi:protein-S-isoprenylcysteine O-methyltransferase Ste14